MILKNILAKSRIACKFALLLKEIDPWCNGSTTDFGSVC